MDKKGNDADALLDALQDMGDKLWTWAEGKIGRAKEETSMYSGKGETTGQPTDTFNDKGACYWLNFNCPKFKAGDARTTGYNGGGKWKMGKAGSGGDRSSLKKENYTNIRYL